jgi:hypothetical protein
MRALWLPFWLGARKSAPERSHILAEVGTLELSIADALEKLLDVFRFRTAKRKDLLKSQFDEFCGGYLEQQTYLIGEIDKFVHFFEGQAEIIERVGRSNAPEIEIEDLHRRLRTLRLEIERRRQEKRAERMSIYKIANERENREFFQNSVLQIVSSEERELFRSFYALISGSFERLDGVYLHDLSSTLLWVDNLLDNPTADASRKVVRGIEDTLQNIIAARANCQENYSSVKAAHDGIRNALEWT